MSLPIRDRSRRVARSHTVATAAFRLGGGFLAVAVGWGLVRLAVPGTWWGPLHAFVAGTVLLAISGATQLFSVTWAAAVPADRRLAAAQRWTVAIGVAGVLVGVGGHHRVVIIAGATLVGAGLGLLGVILVGVVRRSLLRRFDLSTRFYLLALVAGGFGVTFGAVVGAGGAGSAYLDLRTAHLHLNLVGLVGFTILGTLPTLLPTTVRHPMVSGREAPLAWWGCLLATACMALGAVFGARWVGAATALVAIAAGAVLGGIVKRLGLRRLLRAGLPALLIATGTLWLVGWLVHQTWVLAGGFHRVYASATTVGVAGVGLVLFGSLAYLIPVLAGPGDRLTANFARMQRQAIPRLFAGNAVPLMVVLGVPAPWVVAMAAAFVADFAVRVSRVLAARGG